MWLNEDLAFYKRDLVLKQPFVNAPGTLGFCPDVHAMPFLSQLGAFITNPISRRPRQPAKNRTCLPYPGGFLLHTGLPNPGISNAIRKFRKSWANAKLPIIPHLLVEDPTSLAEMVRKLEGLDNIMALELGVPPTCDPADLAAILDAAVGELPVILSMNPGLALALLPKIETNLPGMIHLSPPRGTLSTPDGELVTGRLYGPGTFPILCNALRILQSLDLHMIAHGDVHNRQQAEAMFKSGAKTIALGTVLWQVDLGDLFTPPEE